VTVDALVFRNGRNSPAITCRLLWSGVKRSVAERELPWGPSHFVKGARLEPPSHYELEMQ
jgi:hypothetical protein